MATSFFLTCLRFLPETLRSLVGNGSTQPSALYRPLIPIIGHQEQMAPQDTAKPYRHRLANPFRLFLYLDVDITLLFTGVVYAVNYTITATIASSFADAYPYLTETNLGLCYLSTGGGMIIGSTLTGKLLDREYRVIKERIARDHQDDPEATKLGFPIEIARLRTMPIHLVIFVACVIGWGWCLEKKVSIAGPLILQAVRKCVLSSSMRLYLSWLSWVYFNRYPQYHDDAHD